MYIVQSLCLSTSHSRHCFRCTIWIHHVPYCHLHWLLLVNYSDWNGQYMWQICSLYASNPAMPQMKKVVESDMCVFVMLSVSVRDMTTRSPRPTPPAPELSFPVYSLCRTGKHGQILSLLLPTFYIHVLRASVACIGAGSTFL